MALQDQLLVLARLIEFRSIDGRFGPKDIEELLDRLSIPPMRRVSDVLTRLKAAGYVTRTSDMAGSWRLTPAGRTRSYALISEMDVAALMASNAVSTAPTFASSAHPTIPPWLAPPELLDALRKFLSDHPFDTNVFGMTRFPDSEGLSASADPVARSLEIARAACLEHGLEFHLASDRKLADDLWQNVDTHMWGCRYGMAFFEDFKGHGINYNLTIEIGSMLTTGRRVLILKDPTVAKLPTDLVGRIYDEVEMGSPELETTIHAWLRKDLNLGPCARCRIA